MDEQQKELLKALPKMDELLNLLADQGLTEGFGRGELKNACRLVLARMRRRISAGGSPPIPANPRLIPAETIREAVGFLEMLRSPSLRGVVNATGVILHTNLGRAPLCPEAISAITDVARGYSNLEYDLKKGERGERYDHVVDLLTVLTGAENALVVNNNAAAVLLALNSLAEGREVIVSRGELIEIGGAFRIPEIMAKSGARLREVGTTNRTRVGDYERAINSDTALILKVHTSNYRIVGFTQEASIPELVALGKKYTLPVIGDLGSGLFFDLAPAGLLHEPVTTKVLAYGMDLLTFSGDKLLGGPQAGIIIGKDELIRPIKSNPLTRALRIDKLTLAALEATLRHYLNPAAAREKIPVLKSLTEPQSRVRQRINRLLRPLKKTAGPGFTLKTKPGHAFAGGGSLPFQTLPTWLLAIIPEFISVQDLERRLRRRGVIGRIADKELLLDGRTINDEDLYLIREALTAIFQETENA